MYNLSLIKNKSAKFATILIDKKMALSDIKKFADYAKRNESKVDNASMRYDSGRSSMVYARGNILLGKGRYVTTLKVGTLRKALMYFLF